MEVLCGNLIEIAYKTKKEKARSQTEYNIQSSTSVNTFDSVLYENFCVNDRVMSLSCLGQESRNIYIPIPTGLWSWAAYWKE